jgi:hypothetical protein
MSKRMRKVCRPSLYFEGYGKRERDGCGLGNVSGRWEG